VVSTDTLMLLKFITLTLHQHISYQVTLNCFVNCESIEAERFDKDFSVNDKRVRE
jgi:hypothetical protein